MASHGTYPNRIEDFISTQVISRGLDDRTARVCLKIHSRHLYAPLRGRFGPNSGYIAHYAPFIWPKSPTNCDAHLPESNFQTHSRAYRMDLEKFFVWLEERAAVTTAAWEERAAPPRANWEDQMDAYLSYLSREKGLRYSTLYRKQRVFGYYLAYMVSQGLLDKSRPLQPVRHSEETSVDTLLTKREVEDFFRAIDHEYEELDSDFRRRVCLRDQVMMKLLFYHGLEVSELLRLEMSDYSQKTRTLTIRRKREKDRTEYIFSRALQRQMEEWLSEHVYFEHGGLYHNRMFLSKLGKPLSMKMVINIFDKYRVMAGIEKVCKPKDLKNSLGRYAEEMVREQG